MVELMIDQYFCASFQYEETIVLLERCHGVEVSLRTLHRLLRKKIFTEKGRESCTKYSFFYSVLITAQSFLHWIRCNAATMY